MTVNGLTLNDKPGVSSLNSLIVGVIVLLGVKKAGEKQEDIPNLSTMVTALQMLQS